MNTFSKKKDGGAGGNKVISMPCLGRPFRLGMLYDCRTECLIPGVTLWDAKDLKQSADSDLDLQSYQPSSSFELIAEDSLSDKGFHLNVEAGLKLSFMGGLVDVSGAAKYLMDKKSSKKTSRVTLQFTCTTHFKELSMEQLGNLKYKNFLDKEKNVATHVVTGLVYGADAFFVFDRDLDEHEDYQKVHGEMKIAIKAIPNLQIDGEGKLDVEDEDKTKTDKFHCKFYGDILLDKNPTTFEGAVDVYRKLPQLIGIGRNTENELHSAGEEEHGTVTTRVSFKDLKTVPKTVWLYPLSKLESKAQGIVREISSRLVGNSEKLLEELHDIEMRTNDLMNSRAFYNFQGLRQQLMQFKDLMSQYQTYIMQQLSLLLPEIRGGGLEEAKLADLFDHHHESPFSYYRLVAFLDRKEREIKVLEKCLEFLGKKEKKKEADDQPKQEAKSENQAKESNAEEESNSIQFAFQTGEMDSVIYSFDHEHVLSFEFANVEREDGFLKIMGKYLSYAKDVDPKAIKAASPTSEDDTQEIETVPQAIKSTVSLVGPLKGWYEEPSLIRDMREKVIQFAHFARANKGSEKTCFATTDGSLKIKGGTKGGMLYLYEGGTSNEYTPPSQPGKPIRDESISLSNNSIPLKWEKPKSGRENIEHYTVFYRPNTSNSSESKWQSKHVKNCEGIVIDQLEQETEYVFYVKSVGKIGESEKSEQSEPIKTVSGGLIQEFIARSRCVKVGDLAMYEMPMNVRKFNTKFKIIKGVIGNRRHSTKQCKTIFVTGLSAVSRQMMIDTLFNYFLGVKMQNKFRFKLVFGITEEDEGEDEDMKNDNEDSHSTSSENSYTSSDDEYLTTSEDTKNGGFELPLDATGWLKIYEINWQSDFNIPFSVTIVDIPVAGMKYETNYRQLLVSLGDFDIEEVNSILLVSDDKEPISTEDYDNISVLLSVYGQDVKGSLCVVEDNKSHYVFDSFGTNYFEAPFYIPYTKFLQNISAEVEVAGKLLKNLKFLFEFVSEKCSPPKLLEVTKKVLVGEHKIRESAIVLYHQRRPRDNDIQTVQKCTKTVYQNALVINPCHSPSRIEKHIDTQSEQSFEYLELKKILAELLQKFTANPE